MLSSLMAILILFGFVYIGMSSSLTFTQHIDYLRLEGGGKLMPKSDNITTGPFDMHVFSEQEAIANAEKVNRYSNCLCRSDCKHSDNDWILKGAQNDLLYAIKANSTAMRERNNRHSAGGSEGFLNLLGDDSIWSNAVPKCPYVILDLGSNRGDTLQSYLNVFLSSLYSPSPLSPWSDTDCKDGAELKRYEFDLETLSITSSNSTRLSKRNKRLYMHHQLDMEAYFDLHLGRIDGEADPWMSFQMQQKLQNGEGGAKLLAMKTMYEQRIQQESNDRENRPRPAQYCFYGVEGNPGFTRTLRGLEYIMMESVALRPLRHVHFYTRTVVASKNGPSELYLDSVSANHVGSSVLKSHKYAAMGGEKVEVQGVTLTRLLQQVLDTSRARGHLILKIDIEGGEYAVLKEAITSSLLCDYANQKGKRVDLAVEFHKWVIEDKKVRQTRIPKKHCLHRDHFLTPQLNS